MIEVCRCFEKGWRFNPPLLLAQPVGGYELSPEIVGAVVDVGVIVALIESTGHRHGIRVDFSTNGAVGVVHSPGSGGAVVVLHHGVFHIMHRLISHPFGRLTGDVVAVLADIAAGGFLVDRRAVIATEQAERFALHSGSENQSQSHRCCYESCLFHFYIPLVSMLFRYFEEPRRPIRRPLIHLLVVFTCRGYSNGCAKSMRRPLFEKERNERGAAR